MKKNFLDEREQQVLGRIEHLGLNAMEILLCIAIVLQLLFGADFAQVAGECIALLLVSIGMIFGYVYYGIWDSDTGGRGNLQYALLCGAVLGLLIFAIRRVWWIALLSGFCMVILSYGLLLVLMKGIEHRKEKQAEVYETEE